MDPPTPTPTPSVKSSLMSVSVNWILKCSLQRWCLVFPVKSLKCNSSCPTSSTFIPVVVTPFLCFPAKMYLNYTCVSFIFTASGSNFVGVLQRGAAKCVETGPVESQVSGTAAINTLGLIPALHQTLAVGASPTSWELPSMR